MLFVAENSGKKMLCFARLHFSGVAQFAYVVCILQKDK